MGLDVVKRHILGLKEALERYEVQLQQVETERVSAYSSLEEQIRALASGNAQLQKETGGLVSALRSPHIRGRWGEMTLRRAAELAGMSQHCDFTEQETFEGEEGRLRPDMMVNLPGDRRIVVDVKAPLQAFLDASNAATEDVRVAHLVRHAQRTLSRTSQRAKHQREQQPRKQHEQDARSEHREGDARGHTKGEQDGLARIAGIALRRRGS